MAESQPFPQIINEERLHQALVYVADQSIELARVVLGRELSIDTICLFTHSDREYAFVEAAVRARGSESQFSHGPTLYVDTDFVVSGQRIRIFGVRRPGENRPQVGYGDYPVADYAELRQKEQGNPYVKEIVSGRGRPLIELRHPDFDVLGYIVDEKEHQA